MQERWRWDINDEGAWRERPLTEQAADEVRSWFGDDAAERRRMIDEHHIDPLTVDGHGPSSPLTVDGHGPSSPLIVDGHGPSSLWKPGPYKGVGPRGWRRQDDRIQDEVAERLARDPHVDASDADVTVADGEVVLQGSVETRAQGRRAEDIAWSVGGVRDVQNRLRVRAGELGRPAA